jgi:hypothetical protein
LLVFVGDLSQRCCSDNRMGWQSKQQSPQIG